MKTDITEIKIGIIAKINSRSLNYINVLNLDISSIRKPLREAVNVNSTIIVNLINN